jgi:nucleotide-binding universal stress UspA family protein
LYKKVLLAYDGSIEGRRALREGARIAQLCSAEVFLLAVAEVSAETVGLEGGSYRTGRDLRLAASNVPLGLAKIP